MGKAFVIIVDDYIPYIWGQAVFTKVSSRGDVWGMMAEKAWIKLCGTAENAEGGMTTEVMDFIFACPTNVFWVNGDLEGDGDRCADLLEEYFNLGYFLAGGIGAANGRNMQSLVTGHAYSYHGVCRINYNGNANYPLIRLRNPHGHDTWDGNWND